MTTARSQHPRRATQPRPGRTASSATGRRPSDATGRRPRTRGPSPARPTLKAARLRQARHRARRGRLLWSAAILAVAGVITAAVLASSGSGALQHTIVRPAPGFTLAATNGKTVSLASYRGHNVVLFFSEGAGCDACLYQMREFEQHAAQLTRAGITILPIVMDPASQIRPELASVGLHTPYLIDTTGSVSRAYGVLGKGMHAGLPGHGFVLIDRRPRHRALVRRIPVHVPVHRRADRTGPRAPARVSGRPQGEAVAMIAPSAAQLASRPRRGGAGRWTGRHPVLNAGWTASPPWR
jgi:peroxiredoxin